MWVAEAATPPLLARFQTTNTQLKASAFAAQRKVLAKAAHPPARNHKHRPFPKTRERNGVKTSSSSRSRARRATSAAAMRSARTAASVSSLHAASGGEEVAPEHTHATRYLQRRVGRPRRSFLSRWGSLADFPHSLSTPPLSAWSAPRAPADCASRAAMARLWRSACLAASSRAAARSSTRRARSMEAAA